MLISCRMRALLCVIVVAVLSLAVRAEAQLSRHSIALESAIWADLGGRGGAHPAAALTATTWLEGPVEAVARLAFGSVGEPTGRGADAVSGTLGLRASAGSSPLRPQLLVDAGWISTPAGASSRFRVAWGLAAGFEWFPAIDLSVAVRAGLRGGGGEAGAELALSLAAYF